MLLLGLLVLPFARPTSAQATYTIRQEPIREAITILQQVTGYHFLYRDALVAGKRVTFTAERAALLDAFDAALRPHALQLLIDPGRRQVLLLEAPRAAATPLTLTGEVLDDERGHRLPYATLTWEAGGRLQGVVADASGRFSLRLDPPPLGPDSLVLTASYVGYRARQVRVERAALPATLSIRLRPEPEAGQEVLVHGSMLEADLDTTWHPLIQPGAFSPLSEGSVLRALQVLPAVSLTMALSSGLNVRGSRADGFQVLLDGTPIYSQSHFFGLFDAFNEAALQTVGFYYGVPPAPFAGPPGGTIAFMTRTGSQGTFRQQAGLTSTAFNTTLEGPLQGGRGSWLLSGRHSYLGAVDWFNNDALIAQGLGVGRPASAGTPGGPRPLALDRSTATARFYDLHGKLYHEAAGGRRLTFNVYVGGDHTRQQAARIQPGRNPNLTPVRRPASTLNHWGNEAASLHHQRAAGPTAYRHAWLALSRYHSRFSKDDFVYTVPTPDSAAGTPPATRFIDGLTYANHLLDLSLSHHLTGTAAAASWSAGAEVHHYAIRYEEQAARRPPFTETHYSMQADLFARYERRVRSHATLDAGLRSHYFGRGAFLRFSPRLYVRLHPFRPLSFSAGYSRTHQFLHRLYLEHAGSPDVWIMSAAGQPPGRADQFTLGAILQPTPALSLQLEAYVKAMRQVRQHEMAARHQRLRAPGPLMVPWLHDFTARARGLEAILQHRVGPVRWTHSYTLAGVTMQHPDVHGGHAFPAAWDRRHQYTTLLQGPLAPHLQWTCTWMLASGTPNVLAATDSTEPARLPRYHRLDVTLQYRKVFSRFTLQTRLAVYNVYDRANTWYRLPTPALRPNAPERQLTLTNVDVYDLGFHPSFEVTVTL